jgi:hypothetical protein
VTCLESADTSLSPRRLAWAYRAQGGLTVWAPSGLLRRPLHCSTQRDLAPVTVNPVPQPGICERHTLAKLSITGVLAMQPRDAFERMHISQGEEDLAGRTRQAHGWRIGSPAGILLVGKICICD